MRVITRGAGIGALRSADLDLSPGRYVALSSERDSLRALVRVLAGAEPPRSGQVWVEGAAKAGAQMASPAAAPQLRRKIAALFDEETLPPARTALAAVTTALLARNASTSATNLLNDAGLAHLAKLSPAKLSQRETRSVALALALAHDSAELFVLYEPLATLLPAPFVLEALDAHTLRGAIVLSCTTSPADACALGGLWLCVEQGRLRPLDLPTPRLGAGPWQRVLVETDDAAALARLLHDSSHGLSTELGTSPTSLSVKGPALDVTVEELVKLARQNGIEIRRIEPAAPPVEALLAARAGFTRGAYEASRSAALSAPPPAIYGSSPPPPAESR